MGGEGAVHAEGGDAAFVVDEEVARADDADHVSDAHLAGGGEDGGDGADADGARRVVEQRTDKVCEDGLMLLSETTQ